jgi:hypothetical protein
MNASLGGSRRVLSRGDARRRRELGVQTCGQPAGRRFSATGAVRRCAWRKSILAPGPRSSGATCSSRREPMPTFRSIRAPLWRRSTVSLRGTRCSASRSLARTGTPILAEVRSASSRGATRDRLATMPRARPPAPAWHSEVPIRRKCRPSHGSPQRLRHLRDGRAPSVLPRTPSARATHRPSESVRAEARDAGKSSAQERERRPG